MKRFLRRRRGGDRSGSLLTASSDFQPFTDLEEVELSPPDDDEEVVDPEKERRRRPYASRAPSPAAARADDPLGLFEPETPRPAASAAATAAPPVVDSDDPFGLHTLAPPPSATASPKRSPRGPMEMEMKEMNRGDEFDTYPSGNPRFLGLKNRWGEETGKGIIYYDQEDMLEQYVGSFTNGHRHGEGIEIDRETRMVSSAGTWENDVFVDGSKFVMAKSGDRIIEYEYESGRQIARKEHVGDDLLKQIETLTSW